MKNHGFSRFPHAWKEIWEVERAPPKLCAGLGHPTDAAAVRPRLLPAGLLQQGERSGLQGVRARVEVPEPAGTTQWTGGLTSGPVFELSQGDHPMACFAELTTPALSCRTQPCLKMQSDGPR